MVAVLQVFPSSFRVPPLPHLAVLLVGVSAVVGLLYRLRPSVTGRVVLGFAPWMVVGSAMYALYQTGALPPAVAPLFGSPAVYLSTFAVAGLVWAAASPFPVDEWSVRSVPGLLFATGSVAAVAVVGAAVAVALARGGVSLFWPAVGLVASAVLAAAVWVGVRRRVPSVRATGGLGALVVFAHTLDGVSTAVGTARGFGEQSPLSRVILEVGGALPVAQYVGAGWLFVLVKVGLAVLVAYLLADSIGENPEETYLILGFVAAVGLGPGAHNLVLFTIVGAG